MKILLIEDDNLIGDGIVSAFKNLDLVLIGSKMG